MGPRRSGGFVQIPYTVLVGQEVQLRISLGRETEPARGRVTIQLEGGPIEQLQVASPRW